MQMLCRMPGHKTSQSEQRLKIGGPPEVSQFELDFFLYEPQTFGAGAAASINPTIQAEFMQRL